MIDKMTSVFIKINIKLIFPFIKIKKQCLQIYFNLKKKKI